MGGVSRSSRETTGSGIVKVVSEQYGTRSRRARGCCWLGRRGRCGLGRGFDRRCSGVIGRRFGVVLGNGRLDLIQALAANAASVGDFSLDQPQHQKAKIQILLGTSGVFTFSIVALQGFTGTVDFSVRGLPSNIFGSFDPPTITGSGSVALTLQVDSAAQPGKYKLLITGASGTLLHSIDLDLHVQQ